MNVITNNTDKCSVALEALKNVIDPEIGLNIVDLGLIYQVDFNEANSSIAARMTLTTQFCPMGASITEAAKRALENAFTGLEATVELSFDPPWNHACISEEGQIFLNK